MNTNLEKLLHTLKPDGHHCNSLAVELHRLANAMQEQADESYAALQTVLSPTFKGDVKGELASWPGMHPLELDHTNGKLSDIMVRGVSVSEHLAPNIWNAAEAYVSERYGPETTPRETRLIQRMDANDRAAEQAA
jgi:hypothetical protein